MALARHKRAGTGGSNIKYLLTIFYRTKPVDAKQIGRELGVRYVLEGSVRRSGNQLRVNAQLINAETDAYLWVERFDRDTGNLFALQDEITRRIAVALNAELLNAEAARVTDHPDVLDYILRGGMGPLVNYSETMGTRAGPPVDP